MPPPPAARPVARTDVWDVDPSTMDAMEIDVDAFIVKLRVARDNALLLRTGGVMLAGGWTPGRDASTMKGKVQVATSPALMYTHQVCFSFHSVLDVRLRGRGARQVVVRARVAGGPFFCWRFLRDGFLLGKARKKLGGASEHFLSTFAVHSSRNARLLLGICSLRLSEQKPNMLPACGGIA